MQPYFFPYIGYFQLIHSVDSFVVYDDVNYIKGGWINRNFILSQGEKVLITLQLLGASPNRLINQVRVGNNRHKLLKTIKQSYSNAPNYAEVIELIETILNSPQTNLALFLDFGLRQVCDYLGLEREWVLSSELRKDVTLRGQKKVLAICKELEASHYINMPGGMELYDSASFAQLDVKLSFIEPSFRPYNQKNSEFTSALSIIDVLMNNDLNKLGSMLNDYKLIKKSD
ncbi:hypothetical protein Q7A_1088 [Methylophaga nitratireducenticrescens]|uniref:WbqC-like protein n=2 Tax=Methylophaga nitratireducenticrescens TaxID=754476 RepID=I1XHQ9_METNJ|nr:hypothetical protein Q7A_1088 [Methylophaga nitratireducenticrescens]